MQGFGFWATRREASDRIDFLPRRLYWILQDFDLHKGLSAGVFVILGVNMTILLQGHRPSVKVKSVALASISAAALVFPGLASAQDHAAATAALERALEARVEAQKALAEADKALAEATRLLASARQEDVESEAPLVEKPEQGGGGATVVSVDGCDEAGAGGTAEKMLDKNWQFGPDGKQSADGERGGLNWFTAHCLKLKNYRQYKDSGDLATQFSATKSDGVIEIMPGYTWRGMRGNAQKFRTSYVTARFGGFAKIGDDGDAALFDLDKFDLASGVGIKLELLFGLGRAKERAELETQINNKLAGLRRDCIARYSVLDRLNSEKKGDSPPEVAELDPILGFRTPAQALEQCRGAAFSKWLAEKGYDNWKAIVRPLWGYDEAPVVFGGLEARYAWSETKYYPLYDTITGDLLVSELPAGFPDAIEQKLSVDPFSITAFAGANAKGSTDGFFKDWAGGIVASLTYRRTYETPSDYKDQAICGTYGDGGGVLTKCNDYNVAAPYKIEGLAAALGLKLQIPRYRFFPSMAVTVKPSYDFDVDRWGLEVPAYLFTDSDGKLTGGIKFTCKGEGMTDSGFELEKDCGAAVFLGSSFSLTGAP